MISKSKHLIVIIIILNVYLHAQVSQSWYVNKNASGLNNGTSWANAWSSFSSISWSLMNAGDILYISGGIDSIIYYETLTIGKGNITIKRSNESNHKGKVIIDGQGIRTHCIVNENSNNTNITIDGLDSRSFIVRYAEDNNIRLRYVNNQIIKNISTYVKNPFSQNAGVSIFVFGNPSNGFINNITLDGISVFQDSGSYIGRGNSDAIQIGGANNIIIRNSVLKLQNSNNTPHSDCIQIYNSKNIVIENNELFHLNAGSNENKQVIYMENCAGKIKVRNNFVRLEQPTNGGGGISNHIYDPSMISFLGGLDSMIVTNNTVISPTQPRAIGIGADYYNANWNGRAIFKNNIILAKGIQLDTSFFSYNHKDKVTNNIYYNTQGGILKIYNGSSELGGWNQSWNWWTSRGYDVNSYQANPQLNGYVSTSPNVIDNGVNLSSLGYNYDILGNPRVGNWDIGAFEVQSGNPDLTSPQLLNAVLLQSSNLLLTFSEELNITSAQNINNYSINSGSVTVSEAVLNSNQVLLTTSPHPAGNYLVVVNNVEDLAGNIINPNNNSFTYQYTDIDTVAPQLVSASLVDSITLNVYFSENLEFNSAQNLNNYAINNITINSVQLDGNKVTLYTSEHINGTYSLTVNNVSDLNGHVIDPQFNTVLYEYNSGYSSNLIFLPVVNAMASVTPEPDHYAEKTIDGKGFYHGDPDSRWAGDTMPEWLVYDLGDVQILNRTRLSFFKWNEGRTYNYTVQVSIDSSVWVSIIENHNSVTSEWSEESFSPVEARYVKVIFNSSNQLNWASLWEAEFWGYLKIPTSTEDEEFILSEFVLEQNYPNPFNPSTNIRVYLPYGAEIKLTVFNILGEEIVDLAEGYYPEGYHNFIFDASDFVSGIFIYNIKSSSYSESKKMVLLK